MPCAILFEENIMDANEPDPEKDPFGPPAIPTEVECLHCGKQYDSYLIEWRIETGGDGARHGFWCCPTPGCSGMGFGCDILPVDPHYRDERGGWVWDDEDEEGDDGFDDSDDEDFGEEDFDGPDSDRKDGNGNGPLAEFPDDE
jgi:hypothetical protein